jgi:transcriptional regulator with XRE-family HTH domain
MENVETPGLARGDQSVGNQLRAAREAAGKSRSEIASQTKIAERHLIALEEDRLGDLAARTYAVGFARTYARAVGLDEQVIAAKVREQLEGEQVARPQPLPSFEPGDPARVPTRRLAWIAGIGVVLVVGVLLAFWSSFLSPEGTLPDLIAPKVEQPAATGAPATQAPVNPPPPAPAIGPVVLTATGDKVWVKVTDGKGDQVLQKELALGESWTVPSGISGLQLRTGRPDALQISVGGKPLPALSTEPKLISGVSLAPADLLARSNPGAPSVTPGATAAPPPPAASAPGNTSATTQSASRPVASARPPRRAPARPAATDRTAREPSSVPPPESLLPSSLSTTSD